MKYDVAIVGAGVNGLACAILLARAGRRVLVLEQRSTLGGLCSTEEFAPGFRANSCVDDPGWMADAVARDLGLTAHGYAPRFTSVGAVTVDPDAPPLALSADVTRTQEQLGRVSAADAESWPAFADSIAQLSGMVEALYRGRTPVLETPTLADAWPLLSLGRTFRGLGRRGMIEFLRAAPMPIADFLDERLQHPGLKAALAFSAVKDIQHGPMSGGTTLAFLHNHVGLPPGLIGGRRLLPGGVGSLPALLADLARKAGADIRLKSEVVQIVTRGAAVSGAVLITGEEVESPLVVSSVDVRRTFGQLVDAGLFDPEFLNATDHVRMRSPSVRLHLALAGLPSLVSGGMALDRESAGGSIVLASDLVSIERAYDAAKHGGWAQQPALQFTLPTLHDPSLAPAGQHVLSVHAQYAACAQRDGWTPALRMAVEQAVMDRLRQVVPDVDRLVLGRRLLTPPDVEAEYHVAEGSTLHGELALDQFLFMRPVPACSRYATPLPGLWLCGSSTHPGAGTAAVSGWLAAREILNRKDKP